MVKKIMRAEDGYYHAFGKKYPMLIGSRAQVMHKTAVKTSGNLEESELMYNKHGKIVSKKKHVTAKKDKRLVKAGYPTVKGKFVLFKRTPGKTRKGKKGGNDNKHSSSMGISRS